jgi:hypothetical protein
MPSRPPESVAGFYAGFTVELAGQPPSWSCESSYARIGSFPAKKLIVFQRSSLKVQLDGLALVWQPLWRALEGIDRATHLLLLDSRAAPGQNDAEFEAAFARYRQRLLEGWQQIAVLVQSIPGKLQLQRHQREGLAAEVFTDQALALACLLDTRRKAP